MALRGCMGLLWASYIIIHIGLLWGLAVVYMRLYRIYINQLCIGVYSYIELIGCIKALTVVYSRLYLNESYIQHKGALIRVIYSNSLLSHLELF